MCVCIKFQNAYDIVKQDIEFCKQHNVGFGIRIVRGAYLDQERSVAQREGNSPNLIEPQHNSTLDCYSKSRT